jgi:hypothetical protein
MLGSEHWPNTLDFRSAKRVHIGRERNGNRFRALKPGRFPAGDTARSSRLTVTIINGVLDID